MKGPTEAELNVEKEKSKKLIQEKELLEDRIKAAEKRANDALQQLSSGSKNGEVSEEQQNALDDLRKQEAEDKANLKLETETLRKQLATEKKKYAEMSSRKETFKNTATPAASRSNVESQVSVLKYILKFIFEIFF